MLPISAPFDMEMRDYIIAYPYVSNKRLEQPDGNPLLYLGLMLCAKRQHFPLDCMDTMLVRSTYEDAKAAIGLLNRSRFKSNDPESYDDYIGLCHASHFAEPKWVAAVDIFTRGFVFGWSFNNTGARGINSWRFAFWLYFGVVAHIKLSAGISLSFLDRVSWALSLIHIGKPSESGLQKEWLQVDLYRNQMHKYWLCDKAASMWETNLYQNPKYPEKMGSVFAKYFGSDHMLAKWMRGLIFRRES